MMRILPAALALTLLAGTGVTAQAKVSKACIASIKKTVKRAGVKPSLVDKALDGAKFNEKVVRFSRSQPEFRTRIWDYMAFLVDPARIADGKANMDRHASTLAAVERKYGVDRYIIAALWGIESDYGQIRGEFFLPHAMANLICANRKKRLFTRQLIAGLKLVQKGDVRLDDLYSSWASAFGQTQFIPETYRRLAVDFDRDGRRDLVNSIPDALASTANFMVKAGWRSNEPWGFEVKLPKGYRGPSGRKRRASVQTWAKRGLTNIDGSPLRSNYSAGLLLPAGKSGPAFLVTRNFNALYSYNAAESYALAIGHLSDRLKGRGPLVKRWPTNDPGLTRAQRLQLQKRLLAAGYDIGEADGKIGPITTGAIKKVQAKAGMKQNGRPSMAVLKALGG
ncbi:lytic murein transglycosylase [Sulfitobacter pontiacus]|uniref:lytic murein transglycosylase n=1 Tax=Sulfitobacter pontiacus TaxID=60137 RepID=UPI003283E9F1